MHICNQFLFEDKKTVTFVGCILSVRGMFNVVVPIWRSIIGVLYQIVVDSVPVLTAFLRCRAAT